VSFASAVSVQCEACAEALDAARADGITALSEAIIDGTPVKTGYAQSNWVPSLDAPSSDEVSNRGREATVRHVEQVVAQLVDDQTFYLANCVDYTKYLEDGSSAQAPAGMLALSVERFPHIMREAAIKRGLG